MTEKQKKLITDCKSNKAYNTLKCNEIAQLEIMAKEIRGNKKTLNDVKLICYSYALGYERGLKAK